MIDLLSRFPYSTRFITFVYFIEFIHCEIESEFQNSVYSVFCDFFCLLCNSSEVLNQTCEFQFQQTKNSAKMMLASTPNLLQMCRYVNIDIEKKLDFFS